MAKQVNLIRSLGALTLCLGACMTGTESEVPAPLRPGAERPNIVIIYADDHATAAIGAYGAAHAPTPNLDRLASQGVLFESAFCTNGICAPARAVVLTGKHSHLNGVRDNGDKFDGSQATFPTLLQAAGYQTALFGKWHLKTDPTGFERWEILPGQGDYYAPDFVTPAGKSRRSGYVTEVTTDLSLEWLERSRDNDGPFLLMIQHKAPHRSWMPGPAQVGMFNDVTMPEPATLLDDYVGRGMPARMQEMTIANHMHLAYDLKVPPLPGEEPDSMGRWAASLLDRMDNGQRLVWEAAFEPGNVAFRKAAPTGDELVRWKYQRYIKNYLSCIAAVDESVGRVMDYLDENGLAENTIVVYTSDQGFFLGEHGWYDKRFMYEPALRLPLIVRWPGVTPEGLRDQHLVQNLDLAPTFLDVADVPIPGDVQGTSLVPLLAGQHAGWRRSIYYEYFEEGIHAVQPHYGVRTERYKLMHFPALDEWELYDLERDPEELTSVHDDASYQVVRDELGSELTRLRRELLVPGA
jgi:arylsulfatase A-like enzyme